jgi:hypothetical protein
MNIPYSAEKRTSDNSSDRGYQPKQVPIEKGYKPEKQVSQPVPPPKKP